MYAFTWHGCPSCSSSARQNAATGSQFRCSPCSTIVAPSSNSSVIRAASAMPETGLDPVRPDRVYADSGICSPAFTSRNDGVRSDVVVRMRSTSSSVSRSWNPRGSAAGCTSARTPHVPVRNASGSPVHRRSGSIVAVDARPYGHGMRAVTRWPSCPRPCRRWCRRPCRRRPCRRCRPRRSRPRHPCRRVGAVAVGAVGGVAVRAVGVIGVVVHLRRVAVARQDRPDVLVRQRSLRRGRPWRILSLERS